MPTHERRRAPSARPLRRSEVTGAPTWSAEGAIASAVDHRPKAVYLGFTSSHDGVLLVRIFERDLHNFPYDPMILAATTSTTRARSSSARPIPTGRRRRMSGEGLLMTQARVANSRCGHENR